MSLKDLLYRCPSCGRFGTGGSGDVMRCAVCGLDVCRGRTSAEFEVGKGAKTGRVPLWELVSELDPAGGPFPDGADPPRSDEARVRVRESREEEPVRYQGGVVGFVECLGPYREMRLRLSSDGLELTPHGLEFTPQAEEGPEAAGERVIDLLELRAVQASSSSLQVYTADGVLLHFKFLQGAAFRWERMLQELLREAYLDAGHGRIVEFQPRISVR